MKRQTANMILDFLENNGAFYDVAAMIFGKLDFIDLLNCRLVCRGFYNLLGDTSSRKIWIQILQNHQDEFNGLLADFRMIKTGFIWVGHFISKDDRSIYEAVKTTRKCRTMEMHPEWKNLVEKVKLIGTVDELILVIQRLYPNRNKKNEFGQYGRFLGRGSWRFDVDPDWALLKDFRIFKILNKYSEYDPKRMILNNVLLHGFLCDLSQEKFDELIQGIDGIDTFKWFAFENALEHVIAKRKDVDEIKRFMALKSKGIMSLTHPHRPRPPRLFETSIETGNPQILELITQYLKMDDFDRLTDEQISPLHYAALKGNMEIFEYIYSKAKIKIPTVAHCGPWTRMVGHGYCPIAYSTETNRQKLVDFYAKRGHSCKCKRIKFYLSEKNCDWKISRNKRFKPTEED